MENDKFTIAKDIKETLEKTQTKFDDKTHVLYTGDHFAKIYAEYRPSYPQAIFDKIMAYHSENPNNERQLAVDVGCGTGQSTLPLTKYFKKVIGTDISEDQLNNMPKNVPNLECQLAFGEDLKFLKDESVDLVTIASALHWVDHERFFKEVKRVLKPGGTLAAYTYFNEVYEQTHWKKIINEMMLTDCINYFTSNISQVVDKFQSLEFPFENVERLDSIKLRKEMTVDEYIGYISSFHYVHQYLQDHPDSNFLDEVKRKLNLFYRDGKETEEPIIIKITLETCIILGRK